MTEPPNLPPLCCRGCYIAHVLREDQEVRAAWNAADRLGGYAAQSELEYALLAEAREKARKRLALDKQSKHDMKSKPESKGRTP